MKNATTRLQAMMFHQTSFLENLERRMNLLIICSSALINASITYSIHSIEAGHTFFSLIETCEYFTLKHSFSLPWRWISFCNQQTGDKNRKCNHWWF